MLHIGPSNLTIDIFFWLELQQLYLVDDTPCQPMFGTTNLIWYYMITTKTSLKFNIFEETGQLHRNAEIQGNRSSCVVVQDFSSYCKVSYTSSGGRSLLCPMALLFSVWQPSFSL